MRTTSPFVAGSTLLIAVSCQPAPDSSLQMVKMRDGTELATYVHLPEGKGPFPTVLTRTPYDHAEQAYLPHLYNPQGVATVVQTTRGRHSSAGEDMVFLSDGDGELKDGYDTCAWIVDQPWSDGKIVSTGGSALGITQYLMASANAPGLAAVHADFATANLYRDTLFLGGVFRHALVHNWLEEQDSLFFEQDIAAHPLNDGYWDAVETSDQLDKVQTAGVHIGGWYDIHQQGTLDAFMDYQHRAGEGARGQQKLIMGPWSHRGWAGGAHGGFDEPEEGREPPYPMTQEALFAPFLGLPDPSPSFAQMPTVQYYLMGDLEDKDAPGNEWRIADDWPLAAAPVRFYLGEGGVLNRSCPDEDEATTSYQFDPHDPSPTICGANMTIPAGPCDQGRIESRSDVIVFESEVLADPLEVIGRLSAHLFVDIDQVDADLMVRLTDVYPDSRSMLVADGAIRIAARNSDLRLDLLASGEIAELDVDLWSTAYSFNRGHRVRISITSSNWPRFAVNHNNGLPYPASTQSPSEPVAVRLHHDRNHPSYLVLPDPTRSPDDLEECS